MVLMRSSGRLSQLEGVSVAHLALVMAAPNTHTVMVCHSQTVTEQKLLKRGVPAVFVTPCSLPPTAVATFNLAVYLPLIAYLLFVFSFHRIPDFYVDSLPCLSKKYL